MHAHQNVEFYNGSGFKNFTQQSPNSTSNLIKYEKKNKVPINALTNIGYDVILMRTHDDVF